MLQASLVSLREVGDELKAVPPLTAFAARVPRGDESLPGILEIFKTLSDAIEKQ